MGVVVFMLRVVLLMAIAAVVLVRCVRKAAVEVLVMAELEGVLVPGLA